MRPTWLDIIAVLVLLFGSLLAVSERSSLSTSAGLLLTAYGVCLLILSAASRFLAGGRFSKSRKPIVESIITFLTILVAAVYLIIAFSNPLSYTWFYSLPLLDRLIVTAYLLISFFLFVFVYAADLSRERRRFLIVSAALLLIAGAAFIHISTILQTPVDSIGLL